MPTQAQFDELADRGYFIADDVVEKALFPELLAAARRAKEKVHSGQVDVFTHWATEENTEPWAIRGLLGRQCHPPRGHEERRGAPDPIQ